MLDRCLSGDRRPPRESVGVCLGFDYSRESEFVVGAVVGAVQFLIDGVVWVVTAAFTAVVDLVLFVIDSFIEFWVGLFTFAADLVVAIVVFVVELLIVVLLAIGVAILLGMLSPILVPTALLYLAFISIF